MREASGEPAETVSDFQILIAAQVMAWPTVR
jgi:hypothetical protein